MIHFFTHKTDTARLLRGLLLLSIMMLSMGVNARAQDDGTTVTVTTAEKLEEALIASPATTINVTEDIKLDLTDALTLGASHTLTIDEDRTVTITRSGSLGGGAISIIDKTLTINGGGTLVCAQESGYALFGNTGALILGNITVNITSGQGINVQTLTVKDGGTIDIKSFYEIGIYLPGTLTIEEGGTVKVGAGSGWNRGIEVSNSGQFILDGGGTLTGSDGGTIYLQEGSKVTGMSGKFNDQENELNNNGEITVGNESTPVSSTGLTKGYYEWNDILFAKADPQSGWALNEGALTISSDAGMQNWARYTNTNFQIINDVTSATISDGVTKIVDSAFSFYFYLASVSIPSSVKTIGENAFASSGIQTFTVHGGNNFKTDDNGHALLTYDGKELVAFALSRTGAYTIPNGVETLRKNSFTASELTSVVIPASVKEIETLAFYSSSLLTSVTFEGENPPTIAADAFESCTYLNDIFVPTKAIEDYKTALGTDWADKVKSSDNGWTISPDGTSLTITSDEGMQHWYQNDGQAQLETITTLTLGEKVTTIRSNYFARCPLLATVILNEGLTTIEAPAFQYCTALTTLHLPASLTTLGMNGVTAIAFYYSSIAELTIADGNKYFKAVNGMLLDKAGTTLTCCPPGKKDNFGIPAGVTTIGAHAFYGNEHLTAITLPENLTVIGAAAFMNCMYLKTVSTGQMLTTIMEFAFFGCAALTEISLPESVTEIEDTSFQHCTSLTSITLPAKLAKLGNAFDQCASLETVTFKGDLPETFASNLFSGCTALTDIFVPAGQVDAYQKALAEETGADKVKVSPDNIIASIQSDKLTSFTLKGKAETVDIAIDSLKARYPGVSATLGNGKAIELPLTWTFKEPEQGPKEFSSASKAENTFTWTADKGSYTPSGELTDTALTGEITVTNPAVITDKEVITLSPDETLIGDGSTTAASVTPTGNATFENVKTEQTIVADGTISSITLSGTVNLLGAIDNEGTLILTAEPGTGLGVGTVTNNGIFIDNTSGVKQVTGPASIDLTTPGAEPSNQSGTGQVTITTTPANIPSDASVTYTWQEWQDNRGWTDISNPHLRSTGTNSNVLRTDITGMYRCRITVTVADASGNISTTLLTAPAVATVLPTPPPPPEPVYYNVILPSVEGVVTDPAAGEHTVEEWTDFRFTLRLDEAYNQSVPVVTTDRGDELTPRPSDGAYIVSVRNDNVAITISGIVKNPDPVANAVIRSGSTIVSRGGLLIITTDRPTQAQVITFGGQVARSLSLPAGKTRIDALAAGSYIVRLSDGTVQKVIVQK